MRLPKNKLLFLFIGGLLLMLIKNNAWGAAETSGLLYSKISNPENLFKIELKLYNRQTLPKLISDIKELPPEEVSVPIDMFHGTPNISREDQLKLESHFGDADKPEKPFTKVYDHSEEKYIFGSICYKNASDFRVDTSVKINIYSPNNPNLHINNVYVRQVGINEVYFLVYAGTAMMDTSDEEAILRYKIEEARAK